MTNPTDKDWSDKCILVAEDEESNYLLIREMLLPTKAKLTRAHNGKEAVRIYESSRDFDLILLDIKMPIMNGLETAEYIRQTDSKIPIIAQTVFGMAEDLRKGTDAGFTDYITKPIHPGKFLATLAVFLDEK